MRKIEKKMVEAILTKQDFSEGNTRIVQSMSPGNNYTCVYLHDNLIAIIPWTLHSIKVSCCGWPTPTTKSRLNAIFQGLNFPGSVYQEKYKMKLSNHGKTTIIGEINYKEYLDIYGITRKERVLSGSKDYTEVYKAENNNKETMENVGMVSEMIPEYKYM